MMKIKKRAAAFFAAVLCMAGGHAWANKMESVIAVDFLTVEVVMDEPLAAAVTDPLRFDSAHPPFTFNDGLYMTGAPVPQKVRGYPNTYRIPVSGMDTGVIYQISYEGQKVKTFKVYDEEEMDERYRMRYGDYF